MASLQAQCRGRAPYIQAEPAFIKGAVEIQDEGSQLASLLAGAKPGMQVLDFCAGGGGKTLAMAAEMNNKGQIFATDNDARRLAPIHERLTRAGVRNVQVRTPKGKEPAELRSSWQMRSRAGRCALHRRWDVARHPMRNGASGPTRWRCAARSNAVLGEAKRYVKPGGRLVYITCSLLDARMARRCRLFWPKTPISRW